MCFRILIRLLFLTSQVMQAAPLVVAGTMTAVDQQAVVDHITEMVIVTAMDKTAAVGM